MSLTLTTPPAQFIRHSISALLEADAIEEDEEEEFGDGDDDSLDPGSEPRTSLALAFDALPHEEHADDDSRRESADLPPPNGDSAPALGAPAPG